MDPIDLTKRLAVALAIGLLVGLERGWIQRHEKEGERALGLRTLGLSGLLGGAAGAIAITVPAAGAPLLAVTFAVYGASIALLRYREMVREQTLGTTTIVAALLTFVLGAMAVMVDPLIASAGGVAVAGLLATKPALHGWMARLTWEELRAALVLLTMSLILLPLLPDRDMGPYEALNPRELWLMTILIAAVSAAGYVAIRAVGDRAGVLVSGIAGGLVSSTAVTVGLARAAAENPVRRNLLASGILAAGAVMTLRVLALAAVFNSAVLPVLVIPLGLAAFVQSGFAVLLHARDREALEAPSIGLSTPFDLQMVLKLGALLAAVMLIAKVATMTAGNAGAVVVATLSGLADVDAISLSMLRLAGRELSPITASAAILAAVATNMIAKAGYAWAAGGREIGLRLAGISALAIAAAAGGLVLFAWFGAPRLLPAAMTL